MKILKEKKNSSSLKIIKSFIKCILNSPTHFSYSVIDGKVCEVEGEGPTPTIKKCLEDIVFFYKK